MIWIGRVASPVENRESGRRPLLANPLVSKQMSEKKSALEEHGIRFMGDNPEIPSVGYMCKTDFDYHLGNDAHGATIYPDLGSLWSHRPCVKGCGIIEVEVKFLRVVKPADRPSKEEISKMVEERRKKDST